MNPGGGIDESSVVGIKLASHLVKERGNITFKKENRYEIIGKRFKQWRL